MDLAIRQALLPICNEICFHACSDSQLCLPAEFALPFARLTSEVAKVDPGPRTALANVSVDMAATEQ